ncbi:hypothetical protein [Caproiciproducens sp.]
MAKITIVNEEGQNLNRYLITPTDGSEPFTAVLVRAADITKQGTPFNDDTMGHYVQTEDVADLSTAVQSATIGGTPVPKSGTTLQLPAYPVIPSSLPANGGTADYAHYSSHAVGSGSAALRNITMSTAGPSGGSDGDVWHQYS